MDENSQQFQKDIQLRLYHLLQTIKSEKSWTNKDLAHALDISVSLVEKWCSNTVSSFVKNYLNKIKRLADVSDHSPSSLVAMLNGADNHDDFYSDVVKNLATAPTTLQIAINEMLKLKPDDQKDLARAIKYFLDLSSEERKSIKIAVKSLKGVFDE